MVVHVGNARRSVLPRCSSPPASVLASVADSRGAGTSVSFQRRPPHRNGQAVLPLPSLRSLPCAHPNKANCSTHVLCSVGALNSRKERSLPLTLSHPLLNRSPTHQPYSALTKHLSPLSLLLTTALGHKSSVPVSGESIHFSITFQHLFLPHLYSAFPPRLTSALLFSLPPTASPMSS